MSQDTLENMEGISFNKLMLGAIAFLSIVAIIIALTYLTIYNKNQDAIAENDGYGSEDKRIPAETVINMDEFDITLLQYIPEGASQVAAMSENNPIADEDSVYILVEAEIVCQKDKCNGGEVYINLIDSEDELWTPLEDIVVEPSIADIELQQDEMVRGWLAFLIPVEAEIEYAKVWKAAGPVLFADLPSATQ